MPAHNRSHATDVAPRTATSARRYNHRETAARRGAYARSTGRFERALIRGDTIGSVHDPSTTGRPTHSGKPVPDRVATTATILVTDMVGSTALRSRVGDSRADALRRAHDEELTDVAERHAGRVVKGTGDGLIVAFATVSDAIDAAVAMQTVAGRLRRRQHDQPPIRIGISTGDVTWESGDCFGMPVIEATRLCDFAAPSQIACSTAVAYMARNHAAALASLGEHPLKGVSTPMEIFEVAWSPAVAGDRQARDLPFVGRAEEVDLIGSGVTALGSGTGRVILVSGEPGIGKSRLIAQATAPEAGVAFDVLVGRCHEGESVPYTPWKQIVTMWTHGRHIDEVANALGEETAVVHLFTAESAPSSTGDTPPRTTADIARVLSGALRRMAANRPLVLIFEDLQWADRGTLDLLELVAPVTAEAPVTIFGDFRETEVGTDHPLTTALAHLHRTLSVDRIRLGPLGTDDVAEAISLLGGRPELSPRLVEQIASETGGNALFVQELLLDLRDQGTLADPAAFDPARLPDALRDIVRSRVGRLSLQTRTFLVAASLCPRGFDLDVTADVTGLAHGEALDALEEGLRSGLVIDRIDRYEFAHDLIRHALDEDLSSARRMHLHGEIATRLESEHSGRLTPSTLADLIYHHRHAGNSTSQRRFLIEAGRQAEAAFAFSDAIDFYQQASEIQDPSTTPAQVAGGLARSYAGAGYRLEAARHFLAAADAEPDPDRAGILRCDAGVNLVRGGRVDEGRDLIVATARTLGVRIPKATAAILTRVVALQIRLGFAKGSETDRLGARGRARLEFCSRAFRGLRHVDPFVSALITSKYALLAAKSGDPHHRAVAAIEQAVFHAVAGTRRPEKVDTLVEQARKDAALVDDPRVAANVELVVGTIAFLAGEFDTTLRQDEAADKMLHSLGGLEATEQDVATLQHNAALHWSGQIGAGEANRVMQAAAAEARGDVSTHRLAIGFNALVRLLASDDPAAVRAGVADAAANWHQEKYRLHHVEMLHALSEIDIYEGNGAAAAGRLDEQWPSLRATMLLRAQYGAIIFHDLVARAGLVVAAGGDRDRLDSVRQAISKLRKQKAPWGNALAGLHTASVAALTDLGDGPAAMADAAKAEFEQLGMHAWALASAYRAAQRRAEMDEMRMAVTGMAELGVANPQRAVAMMTPGWPG